jgi:protein arginine kinase
VITSKEALTHLSLLRLGGHLGLLEADSVRRCDGLLTEIQPAHLQFSAGRKLDPEERDAIRAEIVRSRLQSLEPPVNRYPENDRESPPGGDEPPAKA